MSHLVLQQLGGKAGIRAPPMDWSAPPATPRTETWRGTICIGRNPSKALSPCATSALRRRPSPTSGHGDDPSGGSRAAQLYDLERDGAYSAASPLVPESSTSAVSTSTDAGGNGGFLDDGWGVVAVRGSASSAPKAAKPVAKREKKQKNKLQSAGLAAAGPIGAAVVGVAAPRSVATPFFDKSSEAGLMGLALLQARLVEEGRVEHGPEEKARSAAEAAARRERQARTARRKRDWVAPEDLDEGEGEAEEVSLEDNQQQYFEINLQADGSTEVVDFDEQGRVKARRPPGSIAAPDRSRGGRFRRGGEDNDDDDDDPLAFLADLEDEDGKDDGRFGGLDDDDEGGAQRRAASGAATGPSRRTAAALVSAAPGPGRGGLYGSGIVGADEGDDGDLANLGRRPMPGRDPLADEEIEWGLDEIRPLGRSSLMRDLGVIKTPQQQRHKRGNKKQQQQQGPGRDQGAGAADGKDVRGAAKPGAAPAPYDYDYDEGEYDEGEQREVGVAWGGSGGASGIDMEQQEALLARLFKPHKVKELMAHQRAAEAELAAMKRKASGRQVLESKTHSRMRIIAGSAAGCQLASSQGSTTRPMMEKVRQALFNMIQAQAGSGGGLPETSRWLDCFAGTGSVGLEALSRGCREAHFIELDPWVCRKVLSRNIASCGFQRRSVVHTMKAEDFLRRSIDLPRFAGGPFDFISVCPPYLVVSYPEIMDLLHRSPLLHERSIVFVEYPKQLEHQVPPTLGSLVTVRDRKYGRTYIRVYGPAGRPVDAGEEGEGQEEEGNDELLL